MSRNGGKRKGSSGGKPASYGAIAAAVAAVLCYAVWRDRLLFLSHDAQLHPGAAGGALRAARVEQVCTDLSEYCAHWASTGECEANPEYMHEQCRLSCRTCAGDGAGGAADADASQAAGAQAAGVQEDNSALSERKRKWPKCKDKAEECAYWASIGECDKNERYMKYQCALSCDSCDTQDFEKRCRLDPNATKAVLPGQMNAMFERLATSAETAQYEPRVLSRDPWVLVFDRFMSAEEADGIVAVANRDDGVHFTASQGTDGIDEDGSLIPTVSSYRTSKTYWCEDDCLNETSVKAVRERVERLTGIPDANHEYPQILKYEKAQYYNERELPRSRCPPAASEVLRAHAACAVQAGR